MRRGLTESTLVDGKLVYKEHQGRFNADDDQIGIGFPDLADRCGGGSIAGNDQGLDFVFTCKLFCRCQGQLPDFFGGAGAVRGVGRVAEIQIPLPGKIAQQVPQHADAAHAGVKNGDVVVFSVHGFTLWIYFFYLIKYHR